MNYKLFLTIGTLVIVGQFIILFLAERSGRLATDHLIARVTAGNCLTLALTLALYLIWQSKPA